MYNIIIKNIVKYINVDFNMIRKEIENDGVLGWVRFYSTGGFGINDLKDLRDVILYKINEI